jgi:predicted transcriptional regulator
MTERSDVVEDVEFIARSTNRVQLLQTLREVESATRADLRSSLSASRTTLTRNLDALQERGWVRVEDGAYALTPGVVAIVDAFLELEETVATVDHLQPFLQWTTRDAFDVGLEHLGDAEITVDEPGNPWAMVNAHVSRLRESDHLMLALPVAGLHGYEVLHEKVLAGETTVESVVTDGVAASMTTDSEFAPLTADLLAADGFEMHQARTEIPLFVGVLDDVVQVGVDEGGEPRALLETENDVVREWARDKVAAFKRTAEPVTADDVRSDAVSGSTESSSER